MRRVTGAKQQSDGLADRACEFGEVDETQVAEEAPELVGMSAGQETAEMGDEVERDQRREDDVSESPRARPPEFLGPQRRVTSGIETIAAHRAGQCRLVEVLDRGGGLDPQAVPVKAQTSHQDEVGVEQALETLAVAQQNRSLVA